MQPINIRSLILHPGSPKTGTSGIQNALFRARNALIEQGFIYPLTGIPTTNDVARGHHDIALSIDPSLPSPQGELLRLLESLRTEIAAYPDHTVILSSEEFFGVERIRFLLRMLRVDQLTVYVSLRPQHEVMNANYYTEITHNRIVEAPGVYFDRVIQHMRYLEKLDALISAGPNTILHLRLFEKGSPSRKGPVADFSSVLGIRLPADAANNAVEHPTLPARPTLFLRWLNEIGFDRQEFFDVFQSLHRMRPRLPAEIYTMSPARIKAVIEHFRAENQEIRRRFLDGEDSPLFNEPQVPDLARWNAEVGEDHVKAEREFFIYLLSCVKDVS